jgi:DNA repair photolyase
MKIIKTATFRLDRKTPTDVSNPRIPIETGQITPIKSAQNETEPNLEIGTISNLSRQIPEEGSPIGFWPHAAVIAPNNFVHKSLSSWAFNVAVGCSHGCSFCFVPSTSTNKQGPKLAHFGVTNPDLQWGKYVLVREWDEEKFLVSLRKAESTPKEQLKTDGNRAVIYCSTTDPYQSIHHPDASKRIELAKAARYLVTRSLELIRDRSTLHVRILTRSPLARLDFELFKTFGPRLMFGMSLPTLRNDLARIYEPNAPAPTQRLETLRAAKRAGLNVYVAMAPTYPECDQNDLAATLKAVAELDPLTVFMEPINIRAENVTRIADHAATLNMAIKTEVFGSQERWQEYALEQLKLVEGLAEGYGLASRLHLWPDPSLGSQKALARMQDSSSHAQWLNSKWNRISEWPTA